MPCAAFDRFAHEWLSLSCSRASLASILACKPATLVTKSLQVFISIFNRSSVETCCTGGNPPVRAPIGKMGDAFNKLLDTLLPVVSSWVFKRSSWTGVRRASQNSPVGGSCLVPQDLHIRSALVTVTARLVAAGVCLARLPVVAAGVCLVRLPVMLCWVQMQYLKRRRLEIIRGL